MGAGFARSVLAPGSTPRPSWAWRALCPTRGHCSDSDVLVSLTGELCPQLWDEELVGDKYENVTGKEIRSQGITDTPERALCPAWALSPVPGPRLMSPALSCRF